MGCINQVPNKKNEQDRKTVEKIVMNLPFLKYDPSNSTNVEDITQLPFCDFSLLSNIRAVQNICLKLSKVSLQFNSQNITKEWLQEIVKLPCKNFYINFQLQDVTSQNKMYQKLKSALNTFQIKKLTELQLSIKNNKQFQDKIFGAKNFEYISHRFPNLKSLTFYVVWRIGEYKQLIFEPQSIKQLAPLKSLKQLGFNRIRISLSLLQEMATQLPNLQQFFFYQCEFQNQNSFLQMKRFQKLNKISFAQNYCQNEDDYDEDRQVNPKVFCQLLTSLPKLTDIQIIGVNLSLEQLQQILINFPLLSTFRYRQFSKNPSINNNILHFISKTNKMLKELTYHQNQYIDSVGVKSLSNLQKLEYLNLDGCRLGDSSLKVISTFPALQRLIVSDFGPLTNKGLTYLRKIKRLTYLEFSSEIDISDYLMMKLSMELPNLRQFFYVQDSTQKKQSENLKQTSKK